MAALTASLEANDKAWTGDGSAIEATLESRVKLGFTLEEQRSQLAALVAITQDHVSALAIERVSMDVAAITGRDFAAVNLALGKAYVGNSTALKRLGITVDAGTKGMELLNLVQERYVGGAEQVVAADPSKALAANAELLSVKVGNLLLPAVNALVTFGNNQLLPFLSAVVDGLGHAKDVVGFLAPGLAVLAGAIAGLVVPALWAAVTASAALMIEWAPLIAAIAAFVIAWNAVGAILHPTGTFRAAGRGARGFGSDVKAAAGDVKDATASIGGDMSDLHQAWHGHLAAMAVETATGVGAIVGTWADEMAGLDPATAKAVQDAIDSAGAIISGVPGQWAARLADGTTVFFDSAEELVASLPRAMNEAKDAAAYEAAKVPKALADAILGTISDLTNIKQQIIDAIAGAVTDAQSVATTEAILAGKNIMKGFKAGSTELNLELLTAINTMVTSMNTLAPSALETGKGIPKSMAAGIDANLAEAVSALQKIHDQANSHLDLADFARQMGYQGIADYLDGINYKTPDVVTATANLRLRVSKELQLNEWQAGHDVVQTYFNGMNSAWDYAQYLFGGKIAQLERLMGFAGSPMFTHSRELGEGVGSSYMEQLIGSISAALPRVGAMIGDIFRGFSGIAPGLDLVGAGGSLLTASALAAPSLGAAAAALPVGAVRGASSTASTVVNLGGINVDVHGDPSRLLNEQDIADAVAKTLQEQSARFGNHPRVNLG
jgi:hypothetical protein